MARMEPRLVLPLAKALNPGERWITVHPPGHTTGQAVLIQEHPDHSATVIGGAGGALNHLVLRGVKSGADYKATVAADRAKGQAAKKAQTAADKASGIYESKQDARSKLRAALAEARHDFVTEVATLSGWDASGLTFDDAAHAGLSEVAQAKARVQFERVLFARAKKAVDVNRQRLVDDADARAAAGLGELPFAAPAGDVLDARDLDPMPEKVAGMGFAPGYAPRASDAGLTAPDLAQEVAEVKDESGAPQSAPAPGNAEIAAELAAFKAANPDQPAPPKPGLLDDAKKAADLVRAIKKLRLVEQQAREASAAIAVSKVAVEPRAFVLEVDDATVDQAAAASIEQDVQTNQVRTFLAEVGAVGGQQALGGHLVNGAYNALNAAAQAVGGDALIDRSVVDVLGQAGAAEVLARRFQADLPPDRVDQIRKALADYHVARCSELQGSALAEAQKYHDQAAAIEVPDAHDGVDLAVAQEVNDRRRQCLEQARAIVGNALGEMQAGAALVEAMAGTPDHLDVAFGSKPVAQVITQLRALGLKKGDYTISALSGNALVSVSSSGMDRLARPLDVAGLAQIRRNLQIIRGEFDEAGWLPEGFAKRPDLALQAEPGVAPRLALPFMQESSPVMQETAPGMQNSVLLSALRDYIGGRTADGDAAADILSDIQSQPFFEKAGDNAAYRKAIDAVAPLKASDGSWQPIEALQPQFEQYADAFVSAHYGTTRTPLQKQSFPIDAVSNDALHRALAAVPEGVQAMKPVATLSLRERGALRRWWYANVAKESPEAAAARAARDKLALAEPEKTTTDMFGDASTNPEWSEWKAQSDALAGQAAAGSLTWEGYVKAMGSPEAAIATTQDLVRSRLLDRFAAAYNRLRAAAPLKVGVTVVAGNLAHLGAVDAALGAKRTEEQKALVDSLRERSAGKYAAGSVAGKLAQAQEDQAALGQAQFGLFADAAPAGVKALAPDQRITLGHVAEQQIAQMMGVVGQNFRPGETTRIWQPTMSGGKAAPRQRVIKMLEANKRVMMAFGTGSGKTALSLGGFTDLFAKGKVKKGVMVVPPQVIGQFGSDALRYLEPGKFKWHADPGATREQRIAAYKDPATHFCVVGHQSFRDDMLWLGAQQAGVKPDAMAATIKGMSDEQRAAWSKDVCAKAGINFDYMTVDESQYTLNREGKENSKLADVVDAFSANSTYFMPDSGDPVKNDASEVYDLFRKMDPARYRDRAAFMRQYGPDTVAAKQALQREMARYFYPSRIDPDTKANRSEVTVPLSGTQQAALNGLARNIAHMRVAQAKGTVDVAAAKVVSPSSFADVAPEDEAKVAGALQKAIGMVKNAAERRIIDDHPEAGKLDAVVAQAKAHAGKPGVVFAHSREAVANITQRLQGEGYKVVTITGSDSAAEKDKKRLAFAPETGPATADILVASDAAAAGLNLQRGKWLVEYDTPDTAMVHAQRQGRIYRTGQDEDVDLTDLVGDHRSERRRRDRLVKKYGLRELMTSPLEGLDDTGLAQFLHQRHVDAESVAGAMA